MSNPAKPSKPHDKVAVIREALRRAQWNAEHGPPHLRAGRFRPEDDPELMERTRKWLEEDEQSGGSDGEHG